MTTFKVWLDEVKENCEEYFESKYYDYDDAAAEYCEQYDSEYGDGPSERVIWIQRENDEKPKKFSINYEFSTLYYANEVIEDV